MARTIVVAVSGDPARWFDRARKTAAAKGLRIEGTPETGTFAGMGFTGSYALEGARLTLEIASKPMLVPWSMVENAVRKQFE